MSVLVKGVEMPESCDTCFLSKWDTCNERFYCMFDDCPLVEIPVPHGRLIDAETKIEAQYYDEEHEEWTMQTFTVEDIISIADNEVPTVIEAEGTE